MGAASRRPVLWLAHVQAPAAANHSHAHHVASMNPHARPGRELEAQWRVAQTAQWRVAQTALLGCQAGKPAAHPPSQAAASSTAVAPKRCMAARRLAWPLPSSLVPSLSLPFCRRGCGPGGQPSTGRPGRGIQRRHPSNSSCWAIGTRIAPPPQGSSAPADYRGNPAGLRPGWSCPAKRRCPTGHLSPAAAAAAAADRRVSALPLPLPLPPPCQPAAALRGWACANAI